MNHFGCKNLNSLFQKEMHDTLICFIGVGYIWSNNILEHYMITDPYQLKGLKYMNIDRKSTIVVDHKTIKWKWTSSKELWVL